MTIYVISDTHFGHANILTFIGENGRRVRPEFDDVAAMDEAMVERWNARVRPQDHVYHLGDVAMRRPDLAIVKRLNGHKRLVRGNHDVYQTKDYLAVGFKEIHGTRVLANMVLTHIPIHPGSLARFKGNVHGHIHERKIDDPRYVNVSVEQVAYTPVSLEEVAEMLPQGERS